MPNKECHHEDPVKNYCNDGVLRCALCEKEWAWTKEYMGKNPLSNDQLMEGISKIIGEYFYLCSYGEIHKEELTLKIKEFILISH